MYVPRLGRFVDMEPGAFQMFFLILISWNKKECGTVVDKGYLGT